MEKETQGAVAEAPEQESAEHMLMQALSSEIAGDTQTPGESGAAAEDEQPTGKNPEPQETEDEPAEQEGQAEEPEESTNKNDLPIDLDALSDEQLQALGEKLNSGAIERFGELTRKRKEAEERLASLQEQIQNPQGRANQEDNPYKSVTEAKDLQESFEQVRKVIDQLEEKLDDTEGLDPEDDVDFNGKSYQRKDLKRYLREARKAEREWLPAQARVVQAAAIAEQQKEMLMTHAKKELGWLGREEGSEKKATYEKWLGNIEGELEAIRHLAPRLYSTAPGYLAYAVEAYHREKGAAEKAKTPSISKEVKPKPPANPSGIAGSSDKEDMGGGGRVARAAKQFVESGGSESAFEAFLTATEQNGI